MAELNAVLLCYHSIFVVLQPATSASANKAFSCTFHSDHTLY